MTIYTKKGDKGETGLPGGRRLPKKEQLFEVLGNLDQTNAGIGLAASFSTDKEVGEWLTKLQRTLLEIGSALASEQPNQSPAKTLLPELTEEMEKQIDAWDQELPELKNFILPGGNQAGASLHLARTYVRQTERSYHRLSPEFMLEEIAIFLNRLSDFMFQTARITNFRRSVKEPIWRQGKS